MKKDKIKVFISGKVSGMPYLVAYGKFSQADRVLSRMGYKVINPTKICKNKWSWLRCMVVCLWHLLWCDEVMQLDNWEESRGAKIEYKWARFLGKRIKPMSARKDGKPINLK